MNGDEEFSTSLVIIKFCVSPCKNSEQKAETFRKNFSANDLQHISKQLMEKPGSQIEQMFMRTDRECDENKEESKVKSQRIPTRKLRHQRKLLLE